MRHGKKFNHLGRKKEHREAMLANLAVSLIMHKRIKTTVPKAKALRGFVEPLITKAKDDSTHSRRVVFSYLQNKDAVSELFREISGKIAERPGGYTRILKTGTRLGDNAEMCIIELVDYNENMLGTEKETQTKTTRRSRRGGSKKPVDDALPAAEVVTEVAVEDAVEDTSGDEIADEIADEAVVEVVDEVTADEDDVPEKEKEDTKEDDTKE
ncbi:MAG: 50S ribosomal protein L17 [Bacteroidetes bacterium]|jgi:large subunit ribosomal protein L17|nr:50S ribosomal protein L17 [Bacteroidota bacterium]MBT3749743.1 50S ribosomal protein L17 [Bacteroidota bacterium]MBT4398160.1 50S ribosomal protein L17 [Bacteroidota bacterium]MBT4410039.1 50S ribosomal protein L17 [Bacteroidota bacterium]MBT5425322.1 50S ribosomal protein L17 [Bacteroidota bacterium]